MSNKFVVKCIARLFLMSVFAVLCPAQTTQPSNPSPSAQTQTDPKDSPQAQQSQPAQSASAQQTSSPQNGQQTSGQQPADKPQDDSKKNDASDNGKVKGTSNDRLFYTLPNFLTLQGNSKLPPLSVKDKFKVVALGTFDPVEFPWWGIIAAIGQASNTDQAYGQGWAAYAKRYGTTAGDSMVENFMVGAVYPSLLHQDPRYYQSGHGGFVRRSGYAISRIFVTRSDSGHKQFNFSEVIGAYTAACISTYSYHPRSTILNGKFVPSERTFDNTIDTWGTQLSLDTVTIFIKEFWPDVHRKMAKKKNADTAAPAPSAKP